METSLSSGQISFYRENGFLVIDPLLSVDELTVWRTTLDEAINERITAQKTHNQDRGDNYYKYVFIQCVNMWKTNLKIRQLALDPRIGKMATDLTGTNGIRLFHDHALIKQPWANPTNWHLDNPSDPYHTRQSTMFWLALDDATIQNGCLYFLPGTNHSSRFEPIGGLGREGVGQMFQQYPEWKQIDPYVAETKAGAGIFINGMVAHAAGPNMTTRPRRAFAMLLMPEGAIFNGKQSVLPESYFNSLQIGDVLENDEHLPLLYSRSVDT